MMFTEIGLKSSLQSIALCIRKTEIEIDFNPISIIISPI